MSENFSLNDLFKAGMTREQFISKYQEMKQSTAGDKSSVFGSDMSSVVGDMFDTLNADGNDTIDEKEVQQLLAYADDGDKNEAVTENDLKVLYNKTAEKIKSQYSNMSPEDMYKSAMAKNPDILSNTYVEDLSAQIDTLKELISSRQINSSNIIDEYQSKIDDLVLKSSKINNDLKQEYKTESDKIAKLQREANKNNSLIQSKSQEIDYAQTEAEIINKELSGLNPDENADDIESRKGELKKLESRQKNLGNDYASLVSKNNDYQSLISSTRDNLAKLTNKVQTEDSFIKVQISEYKDKIEQEKLSAQADINGYQAQVQRLEAARSYAISQMPSPSSDANGDDSGFHKNDNLMSFDELNKQGLKYSSAKGQKLAQQVRSKVVGFTGYCSRHVSNALEASGLGHERAAAAHMMDTKLEKNKNFKEIKITSQEQLRSLPAGCVVVYEAGAARYSSKYGHIEVTLGNGTAASDGITRNMRYSENMSVFVPVENA